LKFEQPFEALLWSSRYLMLVPVALSLIAAIAMLALATVDAFYLVRDAAGYAAPHVALMAREQLHDSAVSRIASMLDGYLFAAVLIIFALGLYELFISKIDRAEKSEVATRLLLIRNIDDLKERLGKVIFLILVVRYFQFALHSSPTNAVDLLMLAVGIALIALALYLTGGAHGKRAEPRE
jgi:uncharacterized membrane protein YqhA